MSSRVTLCQASLGTINKIAIEYMKTVNALRETAASPHERNVLFLNYLFKRAIEK
jgi:hypothetical protein